MVDDHGGFAAAGFFAELDCDFAESGVARDCCWIRRTDCRTSSAEKCGRLTIHSFTNQPVRLLRLLRFAARMGFKPEGADAGMV